MFGSGRSAAVPDSNEAGGETQSHALTPAQHLADVSLVVRVGGGHSWGESPSRGGHLPGPGESEETGEECPGADHGLREV